MKRGLFAPAAILAALCGAYFWWRRHPSACPYALRLWVQVPHPFITRTRLRRALRPEPGERVLEIGPGTGYYTIDLARWLGPDGRLDIFDLQREMLDHTMRRVRAAGHSNVVDTQGDARKLPYGDEEFDAVVMTTVLGEIPDRRAALQEVRRVLRPGGRLVVGEIFVADPHWLGPSRLRSECAGVDLKHCGSDGAVLGLGYFARFERTPI
jgi:SAM-dependent methyltransferase